jgi:hypothetical protein
VEFDAEAIAKLQERVPMWREYLNTLALWDINGVTRMG